MVDEGQRAAPRGGGWARHKGAQTVHKQRGEG